MDTLSPGSKVLYRQPRCVCVGGGFTENIGIITDRIITPKGPWYKISTDNQGTFVVAPENIIKTL